MAIRSIQASGVWFILALVFFLFVIFNHSNSVLPSNYKLPSMSHASKNKPRTIEQRLNMSETAWEDSVERRHQMRSAHATPNNVPFFPAQTFDDFNHSPYTVWDFFPAVWTCPWDIQRVGRLGDGGKWVCGMSKYEERTAEKTIIYSFGVNGESTFEAEILDRTNAELFAFDFSVDDFGPQLAPAHRSRAHFMKVGVGSEDKHDAKPPFYTLKSLMDHNGHDYIDILKIDVEGSEYTALERFMNDFDTSADSTLPIGQVMIELHLMDDKNVNFRRFYDWWERLESFGMRPTWLEVNLIAVTLGGGKTDPRCVEYVWVNARDPKNILLEE